MHKAEFMERFFRPSWERRADLVARFERGELAEDDLPLDLITVMIRNPDHFLRWEPGVYAAEAILFHGGPVNSVANAIPHTVSELSAWLPGHPGHEAALTDPAFLRLCCNEALRLHPADAVLHQAGGCGTPRCPAGCARRPGTTSCWTSSRPATTRARSATTRTSSTPTGAETRE